MPPRRSSAPAGSSSSHVASQRNERTDRLHYALLRYTCAVATIQIREIPEDAYEVIRKRARTRGRSIQSYMREWVIEFASHPTAEEMLVTLEAALAAHDTPGATRESIQAGLAADRR